MIRYANAIKPRPWLVAWCWAAFLYFAMGCSAGEQRSHHEPDDGGAAFSEWVEDHSSEHTQRIADAGSQGAEAPYIADVAVADREIATSRRNAITNAVSRCSPAIVGINVIEVRQVRVRDRFFRDPFFERFFPPRVYQQQVSGLGSGFLISSDGYILTNDHVAGAASKIAVTMYDGKKYDAELIGSDPTSDVALLKIDGENFPYLRFSKSSEVIIGEWAIAFGNPFGLFDINSKPTVTVGVVSNIGVNMMQESRVYRNMIQTDAAISSGNSGGPLVNSLGEVIGMNTIIYSTAQSNQGAGSIGIGFSIPIDRVQRIVNMLKSARKVNRDFGTGLSVTAVDERLARLLQLDRIRGVVIDRIFNGSPSDKAGFEPGDVILEIDRHKINREEDVKIIINDGIVGETLDFLLLRDGEEIRKKLKLEKWRIR